MDVNCARVSCKVLTVDLGVQCIDGTCTQKDCPPPPCVPEGRSCATAPCCTGFLCNNDKICADCVGIGCSACPSNVLGVCADLATKPGQATCGVTCSAVCNAFCGTSGLTYDQKDCNNAGGGNCQGAVSEFGDVPFDGGPCCKCRDSACPK